MPEGRERGKGFRSRGSEPQCYKQSSRARRMFNHETLSSFSSVNTASLVWCRPCCLLNRCLLNRLPVCALGTTAFPIIPVLLAVPISKAKKSISTLLIPQTYIRTKTSTWHKAVRPKLFVSTPTCQMYDSHTNQLTLLPISRTKAKSQRRYPPKVKNGVG